MVAGQCTLCSCSLTADNNTEEHIIPNAIGGRKKVQGFICRTCNSESGSEWDNELARQLNPLSIHLGIRRQLEMFLLRHFQLPAVRMYE